MDDDPALQIAAQSVARIVDIALAVVLLFTLTALVVFT